MLLTRAIRLAQSLDNNTVSWSLIILTVAQSSDTRTDRDIDGVREGLELGQKQGFPTHESTTNTMLVL